MHAAAGDPAAILHGLYWLSANVAIERPLLIAVDDAQWADAASIGFLTYLTRRIHELPILIIYASRMGEGASGELPAVIDPAVVASVLRPAALSGGERQARRTRPRRRDLNSSRGPVARERRKPILAQRTAPCAARGPDRS